MNGMKMCQRAAVLCLLAATVGLLPSQAARRQCFRFEADTVRVLRNPLNGWVMYLGRTWDDDFWAREGYDAMETSDGCVVRVSDYASTAYLRTS